MAYSEVQSDHRFASWLPGKTRNEAFEGLAKLAQQGLSRPQIAAALGATRNAVSCYFRRYGITLPELRGEDE